MQETFPPRRPAPWLAPTLLMVGIACTSLAWILLALYLQRSCGWMAVAAALASASMLRLGGLPGGAARTVLTLLSTLAIIVLVSWFVSATQIGVAFGLNAFDSALRLGADHAWTLAGLANHTSDWIWMAVALLLAALAAR